MITYLYLIPHCYCPAVMSVRRAACASSLFVLPPLSRRRAWPAQSRQWSPAPAPALALSHEDARPAKCKNRLRRKRPHTKRDGQSVKSGNALRMLRRVVRSGSALLFLSFFYPSRPSPVLSCWRYLYRYRPLLLNLLHSLPPPSPSPALVEPLPSLPLRMTPPIAWYRLIHYYLTHTHYYYIHTLL